MPAKGTAVIVGVGPGLGMSMARRFGSEGYRVALLSRSDTRHDDYRRDLAGRGVDAETYTVDVTDRPRLRSVLGEIGREDIDLVYYGPGPVQHPTPITEVDSATAEAAFSWVWPAIDVVSAVLPGMRARGRGGLLFAGGLSSVRPMPALGQLALAAAALRNYAITLHTAVADDGLYAGTLTIGGVVERGDIHALISADAARYGSLAGHTLDPDRIADIAWEMLRTRDQAEKVFDALD
ncbi:SDR family NAD(P)-dependent oxidoreductase [Nocardia jinanensis]|uniref:Short-chain dehydrogenase n=1 Tax=Nocardia jinanensis TaxID=382504 RepID=A0A917VNV3_9NOCA|nr:SDR family NAD(P)-dependent oxidoreductase [Nocardia jinanensis]GGK99774.1 short-chain dehydrogenase [Nocardia jinanensis]